MVAVVLFLGSAVVWAFADSFADADFVADGVTDLDIKNFGGHAGNFTKHPTSGHEHALVEFYTSSSELCRAFAYEHRLVARTLRANSSQGKVLVARVQADAKENQRLIAAFKLRSFPALLWLTKDTKEWEALEERAAEDVLSFIGKRLGMEQLQPVEEADGVVKMSRRHFRDSAGNFDKHPVSGHTYALVNFYKTSCEDCRIFAPTYRQVARMVRTQPWHSKVIVAHVNMSEPFNARIAAFFDLRAFPTNLWLVNGDPDWEMRREASEEEIFAFISSRVGDEPDRSEL